MTPTTRAAADRALVRRAADGDARAFASLVHRTTGLVRTTAMSVLHSRTDADEIVQETFIAAWRHLGDLADGAAIAGWLVTTARRRSYDHLRRLVRRRDVGTGLDGETPVLADDTPDAAAERAALVRAVRWVLATMPSNQRRCWELRHLGGLSYEAIAAELALPVSTVRGQLARSRAALDRQLVAWR